MTGPARRVKSNFRRRDRIWLCVEILIAGTAAPGGTARVRAYYGTEPQLVAAPDGLPFEVRLDAGPVRSNRPVAALLSAGLPAKPDAHGWNLAAGSGWFLAGSTPYAGVRAVTGSTPIVAASHQPESAALIERARQWHRLTEGLAPADSLVAAPAAFGSPEYPADLDYLETLPLARKQEAFSNYLRRRLTPSSGPSTAARQAVAERIDQVLREAVERGHEDASMLDYFYRVEPLVRRRTQSQLHRLAAATDAAEIEQLLTDVQGFDPKALSTLWAASALGVSSAAAEATLRQALWRATFDRHLEDVNK